METTSRLRVLIIGGGFGGMEAAKKLAGTSSIEITLIDRANHHLFQPLLYQVATAGLSAPAIAAPIRHIFRGQKNLNVLLGEVTAIDVNRRCVTLDHKEEKIGYDGLILAAGATHSYFGHDDWAQFAPGLKTLDDALDIRRRILTAFEYAERENDPDKKAAWLSFAVIGGGPTGVEMAGTLAEIAYQTLSDEFRQINLDDARIMLIEGGERILAAYPPDLSAKAQKQLERLGVIVKTKHQVTGIDADGISTGAERIAAKTVIWAAGVAASPLGKQLGVELDRAGRVVVSDDLSIPGHPEVYVVGDLAAFTGTDGKLVPGVSPAAKQMGRTAAANLLQRFLGKPGKVFEYQDYGSLATIGRKSAIATIGKIKLSGYFAWLFWLFVHIYFLIGFRNRLVVLTDWAWAYWTYERYARIIIGAEKRD